MAFKSLAIIFVMNIVISNATANEMSFCQPDFPASLWEQHPEGIALAMTLSTRTENGVESNAIHVYIKNTSPTVKDFPPRGSDWGIEIYYIDGHGAQVPLHD